MRIRDPGWKQFGSGIRDGKKSEPGSEINIPDPQHWLYQYRVWTACTVLFLVSETKEKKAWLQKFDKYSKQT